MRFLPSDHPLGRHPPASARKALAERLDLPYGDDMQDWEWEVSHPQLLPELLAAYNDVSEDEQFLLVEMMVQCLAEASEDAGHMVSEWTEVEEIIRTAPRLHAATIQYWSSFVEPHEWALLGVAMREVRLDVVTELNLPDPE